MLEWLKSSKKGKKRASATPFLTGAFCVVPNGVNISWAKAGLAMRPKAIIKASALKFVFKFIFLFIVGGLYGFFNRVYLDFGLRHVGQ